LRTPLNWSLTSALGIHNPKNIFDEGAIAVSSAVMLQYILEKLGRKESPR
jgi:hypothetical protein